MQTKRLLEDLAFLSSGLTAVVLSSFISPLVGLLAFTLGVIIAAVSTIDLYLVVSEVKLTQIKRLLVDRKGIAWIWAVAILAIALCPFVYWAVGWPYQIILDTITGMYTFTGTMGYALTAVRVLISYLLGFALLAIVIWAWVNAKSPSYGGG